MGSRPIARAGLALALLVAHASCGTVGAPARPTKSIGAYGSTGAELDWSRALRLQVRAHWNPWNVIEARSWLSAGPGPSRLTVLRLRIGRDGSVRGLKIGQGSGVAGLDDDAVAAIRSAQPLPPPPPGIGSAADPIEFDLGFRVYHEPFPATVDEDEKHDPFAVIYAAPDYRLTGTIDRAAVERVLGQSTDPRGCAHARGTTPYPEGYASLRFTVAESGQVEIPIVEQSAGLTPAIEACLIDAAGRWKLPPPVGGRALVHVRVAFSMHGPDAPPGEWATIALAAPPSLPAADYTRRPSSVLCQAPAPPAGEAEVSPRPKIASSDTPEKDSITRVVQEHVREVQACYGKRMVAPPYPQGRVITRFSIGFDGHVRSSCVLETTVGDPQLDRCVVDAILNWQFPRPQNGDWTQVEYPFVFETAK
jgi:TonB family protein